MTRPWASKAAEEPPAPSPEPAPRRRPKRSVRHPDFEIALGLKLKAARVNAGMTHTDLGKALGISRAQVQKYETGANRITAGALQKVGQVLGVHPGSFFDGFVVGPVMHMRNPQEAMRAMMAIQRIEDPETRKHLTALAEELARADLVKP